MTAIIIPFRRVEERPAKFRELTPEAQETLLKIIDYAFDKRKPVMTRADFRDAVIEMLESGEAFLEQVETGLALKLAERKSDFLI